MSELQNVALPLVVTDAGREAAIDADHAGLQLKLTQIALGDGLWQPGPDADALQSEIKRLDNLGGTSVADDRLHLTITDDTTDTYELGEFGLYTDTGLLFAIYSQATPISEKIAESVLMVSADIKLDTVPPGSVTVEGNNFLYPPATPTTLGVMMDAPDDGQPYVRQSLSWAMMATPEAFAPGMVMMWAGAENQVPAGWQLCNGSGETTNGIHIPDLRSRFVVGAGASYETGDKGGSTTATTSNDGSHSHSVTVNSDGAHSHTVTVNSGGSHDHDFDTDSAGSHSHSVWVNSGGTHDHYFFTNSAGNHSHTVSVSSGGTHSHTVTVDGATLSEGEMPSHSHRTYNCIMGSDGQVNYDSESYGSGYRNQDSGWGSYRNPENMGSSQSHTHSASTASNTGSHSHSASTASTGSHSHTGYTNDDGSHSHSASTGSSGIHDHSGTTDSGGSHSHSASSNSTGSHTHSASSGSSGSHTHMVSTMSPYYALAYIIKL